MQVSQAVSRFLRHIAVERGLSDNTLAAYRRDLGRYSDYLEAAGRQRIDDVTEIDVQGFLAATRRSGAAASSAARMLSTVRGLHRFLEEDGIVPADVAHDVAPPKLPMRLPKAITVDEMARLLASSPGDEPARIRDRALLEMLYATGTRVSEIVALDVDDLRVADDAAGVGLVRVLGKGGKQRLVPVGSYAREAVQEYLVRVRPAFAARGSATPALFLGARGARLSRQSAWLVIQAAAERAGLAAHVSPHTFRHSFATHLLQGGADVRVVQELLGHASVATTQLYTLVTADTLRDMYTTAHPRAR